MSLAALLDPEVRPLFHEGFVRSCVLYEDYVFRLTLDVFRALGLPGALAREATVEDAIGRAGLDPAVARVPLDWILRELADRGVLEQQGAGPAASYRVRGEVPSLSAEEVRSDQERHDRSALPAYAIAALAARHYPAVLRGETEGERVLFGVDHLEAWSAYFANDNVIYAISNALAAIACEEVWPATGGAVLELGGGLGSGADAVLSRLTSKGHAPGIASYRFTELALPFLRRARRTLTERHPTVPFAFARLDMNEPFDAAGVEPGGYALVHGVNTLHVARDLAFTLGEIRRALAPGGRLVVSECVRPFEHQPIGIEFVFNLLGSFREPLLHPSWRPNGGFLTPEQWTAALTANGFCDVRLVPDLRAIRDDYPAFVVAAIVAARA